MLEVKSYGSHSFALYEDGTLLAVCCYRKGAVAVQERLQRLQRQVRELETICEATMGER